MLERVNEYILHYNVTLRDLICRVHTESMTEWETKIEQHKEQKVPRNQWTKASARHKKPQMASERRPRGNKGAAMAGEGDHDQEGSLSSSDDGNDTMRLA